MYNQQGMVLSKLITLLSVSLCFTAQRIWLGLARIDNVSRETLSILYNENVSRET
jgi:hypothetical protein